MIKETHAYPLRITVLASCLILTLAGCGKTAQSPTTPHDTSSTVSPVSSEPQAMVSVSVFNKQGKLVGPVEMPRIQKTEQQWKAELTPEQYYITRQAGTERRFTSPWLKNKQQGVYTCVACGLPLFDSKTKFDSGTGWPSFYQPIAPQNVEDITDTSLGMTRTENRCPRCGAHLGHVFPDGPPPTHLRYCINGDALNFTATDDLPSLADPAAQ